MAKKSVKDLRDFGGTHVFVRVDYNVPLEDGRITEYLVTMQVIFILVDARE